MRLTTERFRANTSKQQFLKFIKTNKLKQYKRTTLSISGEQDDTHVLDINIILNSGREIPMRIGLIKQGKDWKIDVLEKTK